MTIQARWYDLPVPRWSDQAVVAHLQHRARTTRRELLLAAARRFALQGYHATALSQVAEDSAHTKGAVYFHFGSKGALGSAVLDELHASWADISDRIAERDLDPLQILLLRCDAHIACLMYDPITMGGLRVLREQPDVQPDRHKRVKNWQTETEDLLERARRLHLLRPDADPSALSGTLVATIVGHHQLADTHPRSPTTWDRMTTTWLGLLPTITGRSWLRSWYASNWANRPAPSRSEFQRARLPAADATDGDQTGRRR